MNLIEISYLNYRICKTVHANATIKQNNSQILQVHEDSQMFVIIQCIGLCLIRDLEHGPNKHEASKHINALFDYVSIYNIKVIDEKESQKNVVVFENI